MITGMGLVTSLGTGVDANWENLLAGRTGIEHHPKERRPGSLQYSGKVKGHEKLADIPANLAGQVRFLNRGATLGFVAAREAVTSSAIDLSIIPKQRRALFIASGDLTKLGYEFMHPALKDATKGNGNEINFSVLNKSAMNKVNPFFLLESIYNNPFSFLSAMFEFMGPNTSLASLSPCGGHALELACRRIRCGEADIALAVGSGNWITEIPMYEMDGLGILSKCRRGVNSFRPLDKGRDGFIAGEGGAAILLEDAEGAKKRGAPILAEVNGLGNCIEFPSGKGLSVPEKVSKRTMESALEDASFDAGDLAFISPHASGTRKGDRSELQSIAEVLGEKRDKVSVCALKPYTGHMGAASDVAEIIFGVKALAAGIVPGTLNFEAAEAGFEDLKVSASIQRANRKSFLSVSYGIIGQSSCALIKVV
jgi:3-oxoacyl-[acyl-carrier-protein] synthase II